MALKHSVPSTSNILVKDGMLTIQITLTSLITYDENGQPDQKVLTMDTGLKDTLHNQTVLAPLIIGGIKRGFYNMTLLSKNRESVLSYFSKVEELFDKMVKGTYGNRDRLPKQGGEGRYSAPKIVYYLLNKTNPLTTKDFINMRMEDFDLLWLIEAKKNPISLSYEAIDYKSAFKKAHAREIACVRAILLQLKAHGKL